VVPKEVFAGAKPLWEDFLIGKFLNTKAPHVGKVHMIVNKIWRLGDKSSLIDVFEIDETTIKFRIRNAAMRQRVLNKGMWNIMDIPMIISKWTPYPEEVQPAMKSIPLWITLTSVPFSMFTDKGLEFLASAVGKPIRLHPKTEACESFEEARVLVEADLTKDLPKEYVLAGEEEGELEAVVQYAYPWLPPRCSCCQNWGHLHNTCLSAKQKDVQVSSLSTVPVVAAQHSLGKEDETVAVVEAKENSTGIPLSNDASEKAVTVSEKTVSVEEKSDEGWLTPPKHGRSPTMQLKHLKYGEVSLLSNAYSALSGEEEMESEEEDKIEKPTSTQIETQEDIDPPTKDGKTEVLLRQSLPRGSKTAHKIISTTSSQTVRDNSRVQSKKNPPPPKRH